MRTLESLEVGHSALLFSEMHDGGSAVGVQEGLQDVLELLITERGPLLAEHAYIDPDGWQAEFGADGEASQLVADSVGDLALVGAQDPELAEHWGEPGPVAEFLFDGQGGLVAVFGGSSDAL